VPKPVPGLVRFLRCGSGGANDFPASAAAVQHWKPNFCQSIENLGRGRAPMQGIVPPRHQTPETFSSPSAATPNSRFSLQNWLQWVRGGSWNHEAPPLPAAEETSDSPEPQLGTVA